jgi:hypothetical protein
MNSSVPEWGVQIVGVIALVSTWGAGLLLRNSGWGGIRTRGSNFERP